MTIKNRALISLSFGIVGLLISCGFASKKKTHTPQNPNIAETTPQKSNTPTKTEPKIDQSITKIPEAVKTNDPTNLVTCETEYFYVKNCKAKVGILAPKATEKVRFDITYQFDCDDGSSSPIPSSLKIVVDTEDGQTNENFLRFKSSNTFSINGFGPVNLIDDDPVLFASLSYSSSCKLSVNINSTPLNPIK